MNDSDSLKINKISGSGLFIPGDDIDTDRIVPARFLKSISFEGLGKAAFYDERYSQDGNLKNHPMNSEGAEASKILVSGRNFGCGSSREHAPQALFRFGLRAIVAGSFADIFFNNSVALGLACLTLNDDDLSQLQTLLQEAPQIKIEVDLKDMTINLSNKTKLKCFMPASAREAFLTGKWDPLSELLEKLDDTRTLERSLPHSNW